MVHSVAACSAQKTSVFPTFSFSAFSVHDPMTKPNKVDDKIPFHLATRSFATGLGPEQFSS
jgi:hypothetical protein